MGLVALGAFSLAGFLADAGLIPRFTVYLALTQMWSQLHIRVAAGAIFLFLLALSIYLPASTWLKGAEGFITLSSPLGSLSISTRTISKFIQRMGERMEEVGEVKIRIKPAKEGVTPHPAEKELDRITHPSRCPSGCIFKCTNAVKVTIDTMRFHPRPKTVGGPIDVLVIKPNKTFWVRHKTLHA